MRARATRRPTSAATCRRPTLKDFLKPELRFAGEVPGVLSGGAVLLALAALVLGAGFTASEFSTGSIGTWLTFEPRRLRVFGSKLLAAGAGVVPLAVLTLATMTAAVWVFAHLWGSTTGPAGTWGHIAAVGGRAVAPRRGGRGGGCGDGHPAAAHRRRPRRGARRGPWPARASCAAPCPRPSRGC